jgi:TonB family protein
MLCNRFSAAAAQVSVWCLAATVRWGRLLLPKVLVCAVGTGACLDCWSDDSNRNGEPRQRMVSACDRLTDAGRSPFPFPEERVPSVCACAADRLQKNDRMHALSEVLLRNQGSSGEVADRRFFIAKITAAVLACLASDVDAMAEQGEALALSSVTSWLDGLDASVPEVWAADRGPTQPASTGPPDQMNPISSCNPPKYPPFAVKAGATGAVTISFLVDTDGHASKVRVDRSSGDTVAHKLLDVTAAAGVSKCQFKPGTVNGKPVASWAKVMYVWKLE